MSARSSAHRLPQVKVVPRKGEEEGDKKFTRAALIFRGLPCFGAYDRLLLWYGYFTVETDASNSRLVRAVCAERRSKEEEVIDKMRAMAKRLAAAGVKATSIPVDLDPDSLRPAIALVGATGTSKTTTLIALAVRNLLPDGALVSAHAKMVQDGAVGVNGVAEKLTFEWNSPEDKDAFDTYPTLGLLFEPPPAGLDFATSR